MACLLIVDDDSDNAERLADLVTAQSAYVHQIVCIKSLADFRQIRRHNKPDLVLVELLRHQSNGFTLATALSRQTAVPVVLLTDRELVSDHLWASARGIRYVLSRRAGPVVMVQQLDSLLRKEGLQVGDLPVRQPEPMILPKPLSKSLKAELTTDPVKALLLCLREELSQLPCELSPHQLDVAINSSRPLFWLENIRCYIRDNAVRDAVQAFVRELHKQPALPRGEPHQSAWIHARENLMILLEPPAHSILLERCKESWVQISQGLQAEVENVDASDHNTASADQQLTSGSWHSCTELLNAMSFLPDLEATARVVAPDAESCNLSVVERIQGLLEAFNSPDVLQHLKTTECLKVLGASIPGSKSAIKAAWRDLAGLCLMLRSVAVQQCWQPTLDQCVQAMYGWTGNLRQGSGEQLLMLTLRMLERAPGRSEHGIGIEVEVEVEVEVESVEDVCLPAEITDKLHTAISDISAVLDQKPASHRRLSCVMVSVYKLRSWLETGCADAEQVNDSVRCWQLVTGCLYELVCHGVLQAGAITQADIGDLRKHVSELLNCIHQGVPPAENTLRNLTALEITIARRSRCSDGQEHKLLAAGLQRLPKPDRMLADIVGDIKLSGTALSEVTHELRVLTDGAQRLEVGRVESLARLMLDCYQQLTEHPGLLQQKTLRLSLGRAHRTLCRLLDQAAAWQPLDQSAVGLSVSQVIDDLFTQFDLTRQTVSAVTVMGDGIGSPAAGQAAWLQCQSLNRRLRQLIRRSDNLSDYRSLMVELLHEQQAVITPYLPYQMPR